MNANGNSVHLDDRRNRGVVKSLPQQFLRVEAWEMPARIASSRCLLPVEREEHSVRDKARVPGFNNAHPLNSYTGELSEGLTSLLLWLCGLFAIIVSFS